MMQGCVSDRPRPRVMRPLTYRVARKAGGWAVVVNDCATRPMADRARAEALALRLQSEADGLRHTRPARAS